MRCPKGKANQTLTPMTTTISANFQRRSRRKLFSS
jgi:hypothetical protein